MDPYGHDPAVTRREVAASESWEVNQKIAALEKRMRALEDRLQAYEMALTTRSYDPGPPTT